MSDDALEKNLQANLTRVNDWLKFAETKNAALLTFSSAWLVAICTLWSNVNCPPEIRWPMLVACPFVLFASLTAIISLLPKMQRKNAGDTAAGLTTSNLLYHGNLSGLDLATATTALVTRYKPKGDTCGSPNHIQDLCTQLVETSRITERKFRLFSRGAYCILGGLVAALITSVVMIAT